MQLLFKVFLREGWLLRELNHTYITLIPKVQGAYNFNQFRPISLYNICYKVISKILISRLRPLLKKMIDSTQVAFIPNRNIAENIILVQEIVHNFRTKRKKKGCIGLKIDFQKAYDKMEWSFPLTTFKAFGFCERFISLIQQCLSTVSYTLLINGSHEAKINPSRGLR